MMKFDTNTLNGNICQKKHFNKVVTFALQILRYRLYQKVGN